MYGAIEMGGTSIRCAISHQQQTLSESMRFSTTNPLDTVAKILTFFQQRRDTLTPLKSIGVASFGPIDVNPQSPHYGKILKTPKSGWSHFALLKTLQQGLQVPMTITTDVNAAIVAEHQLGAARGVNNAVYVTVGTGIGAGIIANGQLVNGFMHPEIGHMRIPDGGELGNCSFHGACLEGLASGPAIATRAGMPAEKLEPDHSIWDKVAINLADMCNNLIMTLACERIVLGGGVLQHPQLRQMVRKHLGAKLNSYMPLSQEDINQMIVKPQIDEGSGLIGALLMAQELTD